MSTHVLAGLAGLAGLIRTIGGRALAVCEETGAIAILLGRVVRAFFPPSFDGRALLRHIHRMGNQSLPIIALTAFFTGGIMVIQAGVFIHRYDAVALVGWATGYATLREVGPILIGLMFSGRVGSNNTAELATMTVTEQVDGLRALAIDPVDYLIAPRVLAMTLTLFCLTMFGDLIAMFGAGIFSKLILQVEISTFYYSFAEELSLADLAHGLIKSAAFGLVIALTSCHFGVTVRGGAIGVGRAVNAAVVSGALGIVFLDFLLTFLVR